MTGSRPRPRVVDFLESDSYRSFAALRRVNQELVRANDALRRINRELLQVNEDLQDENLTLANQLTKLILKRSPPGTAS